MSDLEALLWNVDKDPYLSSNFGSVTLLASSPDLGRFRRRMLQAVARIPRLHQRVVPALGRMAPPEWQDDPDFDIDRHVRHLALPAPGTERQLFDLAAQFVQDPIDRTRPLWEFILVDGLPGGRAALLQKMHHTITDGEGGIRLSEQFIDVVPDAPDIDEVLIVTEPHQRGSLIGTATETVTHGWHRTLGIAQRSLGLATDTALHPTHLGTMGSDAVETGRSVLRQITVTDQHHSPLWHQPSLGRRLEVLDVSFDDARVAAKELGGSLNDLFVTASAAAAGAYHRDLGSPVDELRMAMPISTRQGRSAGGNSFVPTRVLMPTGDLDPVTRFELVHEALGRTKTERAIGLVQGLAGLVNLLPTSVVVRIARQQAETVDFTTSNVRAAPFDLYIAGAHIEATYPLGPLAGCAFNATVMSYRGWLNVGLHLDTGLVTEPELLRSHLVEAFAELIAAAS
ncbi:MAG: wax ester/triacylglycerol synthase domain-containing protein [Acidimicrobiales bacterium]